MRKLTTSEINSINEINGTMKDRYEYFDKIASILNAEYTRVRWNKKYVEAIKLDNTTILDIQCKTVKGNMMIKLLNIEDFERTEEHQYGQFELYELKKCNLIKTMESK